MTSEIRKWSAIVLGGQRPGIDPLATHFGIKWKALVPIAGKPMLQHVLETLKQVPAIGPLTVLTQEPSVLQDAIRASGGATIVTSTAGISESVRSVAGEGDAPWPVLVTTADHPLLTVDIVEDMLAHCDACDIAIGMVERQVMMAAYPDNKRTWLKFRDGQWSGANLFALNGPAARRAIDLWVEAEKDRKTAWKLFLHFGPWLAFRALTRTITLEQALAKAGERLGIRVRLVPLANAEAAIDVDKPSDHALVEDIFRRRTEQA
jgi:GTP:adenosylcobinamide-phosphate guanylyltransferase